MNKSSERKSSVSKKAGKKPAQSKTQNKVIAPLAKSKAVRIAAPSFEQPSKSDGRIRIKHREYLGDISGSVAFAAVQFSVNPGLATSFPWLSTLASRFESYLFRRLRFIVETQKSASTNGSVMMAIDYDASDQQPTSKVQLMSYHNAVRSAVWDECHFVGDQGDLKKFGVQRYIRSGNIAANLDIKTYDVGNLFVATQGCADTSAVGELYVDYDVELMTPQFDISADAVAASVKIATTGAARATPFTGVQTVLGGLPVVAAGNTVTFNKPGQYILLYEIDGTVMTNTLPTLGGTVFATAAPSGYLVQYANAAATSASSAINVNCRNSGETVTFDFTASCTTLTGSSIRVMVQAISNL